MLAEISVALPLPEPISDLGLAALQGRGETVARYLGDKANVDDLHRVSVSSVAVGALVLACEDFGDRCERCPFLGQRDSQFEGLAAIFGIDGALDHWRNRPMHQAFCLVLQRLERSFD